MLINWVGGWMMSLNGWMGKWIYVHMDEWMDVHMDEWMNGWMDVHMDEWMDGWIHEWTDEMETWDRQSK